LISPQKKHPPPIHVEDKTNEPQEETTRTQPSTHTTKHTHFTQTTPISIEIMENSYATHWIVWRISL